MKDECMKYFEENNGEMIVYVCSVIESIIVDECLKRVLLNPKSIKSLLIRGVASALITAPSAIALAKKFK